jgi:hypothetical protein
VGKDPLTWPEPTAENTAAEEQYGRVRGRTGDGLPAQVQNHAPKGTRGPQPLIRGTRVLVEGSRLPKQTREPQGLWLWWQGPSTAARDLLWRASVRRFAHEPTFRFVFVKHTLSGTPPRVRHPEQADRWTWLVLLASTQLRLARPLVADQRLPWERRRPAQALPPYRVCRAFPSLLSLRGTPANPPQLCGRAPAPGRPKGARSGPARRYPAITTAA